MLNMEGIYELYYNNIIEKFIYNVMVKVNPDEISLQDDLIKKIKNQNNHNKIRNCETQNLITIDL